MSILQSATDVGKALGTDYFLLRSELTQQETDYLDRTRRLVEDEVLPVMPGYWERAELPVKLARRLGELGLVGDGIEGYGCTPMSTIAAGLIQMELSRRDGSLGLLLAGCLRTMRCCAKPWERRTPRIGRRSGPISRTPVASSPPRVQAARSALTLASAICSKMTRPGVRQSDQRREPGLPVPTCSARPNQRNP